MIRSTSSQSRSSVSANCGARRERRHCFVADAEQYAPRHRLLVILDFLFDEELVLVLERARRSLGHATSAVEDARKLGVKCRYIASAHAGSTCTVTCDVPNSRSIAASTASASRCASIDRDRARDGDRHLGEQLP